MLQPLVAVRLIRDAMLRLDPSCIVLTSTHLLLVRLCLRARAYSCALPVLDRYICHFPSSKSRADDASSPLLCASHDSSLCFITDASGLSSKLTYKDYLQYYLYGGMIYLALKQWTKAVHFLGIVISMPTTGSVSMIMVEAYKKWILVNLLDKGKVSCFLQDGTCAGLPNISDSFLLSRYHHLQVWLLQTLCGSINH